VLRGVPRQAGDALERVVVAHEVQLVVEDELAAQRVAPRGGRLRLLRLRPADVEQRPEDLVHRQEGRGHAAARAQEAAPVEAEAAAVASAISPIRASTWRCAGLCGRG
jgi:hypothetical protein